jgi:3-phosphoshikimate 1-carboxyvinyltransferase
MTIDIPALLVSAMLLAGLYAEGMTRITEPAPTRDHTERLLAGFGYLLRRDSERTVAISGGGHLTATPLDVPADISSAAFFLVGASIAPGSDLVLEQLDEIAQHGLGDAKTIRVPTFDYAEVD